MPGPTPPQGTLAIAGLTDAVEVLRDRWGVPHIYAKNRHDLYLAQGFVTASDRLFHMELLLRTVAGRLSEWFGEAVLPMDRWVRVTGAHLALSRPAPDDAVSTEMTVAYAQGVQAWIGGLDSAPAEYALLGVDPWFPSPDDAPSVLSGAWTAMSLLPENWDSELLRTALVEAAGWDAMALLCPGMGPETNVVAAGKRGGPRAVPAADLLREVPLPPSGVGSNSWAVAGDRTTTGKPLLANDPHQAFGVPSMVYECHLSAPGVEVSGVSIPFSPGVVVGHTPTTAWGITNATGDCQDLFLECLNADGSAVLYEGRWEPTRHRDETIAVRGREPVVVDVVSTRHGPVIDQFLWPVAGLDTGSVQPSETYALRWTGAEATFAVSVLHRLATAPGLAVAREALRDWSLFGINFLWADAGGDIGYQCAGVFPRRRRGDGSMPVPGWTAEYEWDGVVPFDELPWSHNPDSGFLVTANQCMYDWTYPHNIGRDFAPPYRARRAAQLITETARHDVATFMAMQRDTVSLLARELLPILRTVDGADSLQDRALEQLADWDGDVGRDSVAAAIYEVWVQHLVLVLLEPLVGPDLAQLYLMRRGPYALPALLAHPTALLFGDDGDEGRSQVLRGSLARALSDLRARLGEDMSAWRWGALHRASLVHAIVTAGAATDTDVVARFTAGDPEVGGDSSTLNNASHGGAADFLVRTGTTWRHIIDLDDVDASVGTTSVGQSSDPNSPHFADIVAIRFADGYHALPLAREAVETVTTQRLRLAPG